MGHCRSRCGVMLLFSLWIRANSTLFYAVLIRLYRACRFSGKWPARTKAFCITMDNQQRGRSGGVAGFQHLFLAERSQREKNWSAMDERRCTPIKAVASILRPMLRSFRGSRTQVIISCFLKESCN